MRLAPHFVIAPLVLALASVAVSAPSPPCPPSGMSRADLLRLKQTKFEVASPDERNRLATTLLSCLDDPDPAVRDGVVFEALFTWLRGKALTSETILALDESLRRTLDGEEDRGGFRLSFAALALSEVARADRVEPVFSESRRAELVALAARSLIRVKDYRGFDADAGWRHGVAHGSDLVLQLALNPQVTADGLRSLMDAIRSQVAPPGTVFYTFGEPERLARAVVFAHRRGLLDVAYWDAWFAAILEPKPAKDWRSAFESVEGLAKRHNTLAFLHALSFAGRTAGGDLGKALGARADQAAARIGS